MPTWLIIALRVVLASIVVAFPIAIGYPNNWFISLPAYARFLISGGGMGAVVILNYWIERERLTELRQQRDRFKEELATERKKFAAYYIRGELRSLVEDLNLPGMHRAYIYLKNPENGKLKVYYEHGMEGMPDHELEFAPDHGWAWETWNVREHVWCDLQKLSRSKVIQKWRFTSGQFRVISSTGVKSVLLTPITMPNNPDISIAVLGVDSNRNMSETRFNTKIVQDAVYKRAFLIGHMMIGSGLIDNG